MKEKKAREERCLCPYCEEELLVLSAPFCQACGVIFRYCLKCQVTVLDKKATRCPECGGPLSSGRKND